MGIFSRDELKVRAMENKIDLHLALVVEAHKWLGVRESGHNSGKEVEAFQRAVDGVASQEAWCAAFVSYCVKAVNKKYGIVNGFRMNEWVKGMWMNNKLSYSIKQPIPGSIILMRSKTNDAKGHCGIVASYFEGTATVIEGNTNEVGSREGDGVYRKRRYLADLGGFELWGFLDPFKGIEKYV